VAAPSTGAGDADLTDDLCADLEAASQGWNAGGPTGAMLTSTRAFLARASEDEAVLRVVAARLSTADSGAAAWMAVSCGTAVERGASAELSGPAVFELLRDWLPRLPRDVGPESSSESSPEQTTRLALFRYLCQAAVSHLSRLPALRETLSQDAPLLERLGELEGFSPGAVWVREALLKTSGALILLHPTSGSGLRLIYSNVSNCFHLFSLLQTAVGTSLPGGREPDAAIARVARGRSNEAVTDEAWWHYGSAQSKKADLATSIWGEGMVSEIPRVDGVPVILAWPPQLQSRSWDAGFLGPHLEALPAEVLVERALTDVESQEWLTRLGVLPRKPWWRFW
jgi:hypothetical protein